MEKVRSRAGAWVPVLDDIHVSSVTSAAQYAVSETGVLAYLEAAESRLNRPAWVERDGSATPLHIAPGRYNDVRLSPDAERVALSVVETNQDLWIYSFGSGTLTRLTVETDVDETPVWSPDGRDVVYASSEGGSGRRIVRKAADGIGGEELLWRTDLHAHAADWLPAESGILLDAFTPETREDVLALELDGEPEPKRLLDTSFGERLARVSPDGEWIAYVSDVTGRNEVYVQPYPELNERYTISAGGGTQPVWSRDSRELYYRSPTHVMALVVPVSGSFRNSTPEPLFEDVFSRGQRNHTSYDVAPDGRFLALMRVESSPAEDPLLSRNRIHVVTNWFTELEERAPVDN